MNLARPPCTPGEPSHVGSPTVPRWFPNSSTPEFRNPLAAGRWDYVLTHNFDGPAVGYLVARESFLIFAAEQYLVIQFREGVVHRASMQAFDPL